MREDLWKRKRRIALGHRYPEVADYFWIPMAQNNALFDTFVIEFKNSAQEISAIV